MAAMSSAASALARLSASWAKKRPDLGWATELLTDTLAKPDREGRARAPGAPAAGGRTPVAEVEDEDEDEEEDEDEAKAPDTAEPATEPVAGEATAAPTAVQRCEALAVAEARAEAAEEDLAEQERVDAAVEGAAQTVLCTLRKGWAVAARAASIAALPAEAQQRHEDLTTS